MRYAVVGAIVLHATTFLFGLSGVEPRYCYQGFCKQVVCKPISASECIGKVVAKASECGCCDYCVKQLELDEICFSLSQFGMAHWGECKNGLKCNTTTFRCDRNLTRPIL